MGTSLGTIHVSAWISEKADASIHLYDGHSITYQGFAVTLAPKPTQLLHILLKKKGLPITALELSKQLFIEHRNLIGHVAQLGAGFRAIGIEVKSFLTCNGTGEQRTYFIGDPKKDTFKFYTCSLRDIPKPLDLSSLAKRPDEWSQEEIDSLMQSIYLHESIDCKGALKRHPGIDGQTLGKWQRDYLRKHPL